MQLVQATPAGVSLPPKYQHLMQRLDDFKRAARPGRVSLAVLVDSEPLFLEYDGAGALQAVDASECPHVQAGCFAKPVTASLLAGAVAAGRIDWATGIGEALGARGALAERLEGISVSHLLTHTHGLDGSGVEAVPRTTDGFIDTATLGEQLAPKPLSSPGELYSYGNAGAWLAGAALERLMRKPYAELLSTCPYLSGDLSQADAPSSVCPATGGALALTTAQWLSFARLHMASQPTASDAPTSRLLASLRTSPIPLPGWSPTEKGACLGWKSYGDGWFGHTSNTATSIAFLRFNPADRTAILLSATSEIALFAFSFLFRDSLPELKNVKFPRLLTRDERASLQLDPYIGTYAQSKTRLVIARTDDGRLSFSVDSDDPSLRVSSHTPPAADDDIFFPDGGRAPDFPFIQFLRSADGRSCSHIWNGKRLWRREE